MDTLKIVVFFQGLWHRGSRGRSLLGQGGWVVGVKVGVVAVGFQGMQSPGVRLGGWGNYFIFHFIGYY